MEELLRSELGLDELKCLGAGGSGCISEGAKYVTGRGEELFVKINNKSEARRMFDGEFRSLECLNAADIVQVPKPIKLDELQSFQRDPRSLIPKQQNMHTFMDAAITADISSSTNVKGDSHWSSIGQVIDLPEGGSTLVMQYIQMNGLSSQAGKLGELMARLHLQNSELLEHSKKTEKYVGKAHKLTPVTQFGFDISTCCGYIPQDNTWQSSWPDFYAQKLKQQLDMVEKTYRDQESRELWSQLQLKLPSFFEMLDTIQPALMHGDLWGGNVGQNEKGPVIFDPASFYGHSEYDLAIAKMFGGFSSSFFDHYHKFIPQATGFRKRTDLYKLFHYLNHWNHFGGSYRDSSISIMHRLVK